MKYSQFIPWLKMSNVLTQESMQNFWVSIKRLLFSIKLFDSLVSSKLIKCKISIAHCPLKRAKSLMVLQCHLYQIAYVTALQIVISTKYLNLQQLQLHHLLYQQSRPRKQINQYFRYWYSILQIIFSIFSISILILIIHEQLIARNGLIAREIEVLIQDWIFIKYLIRRNFSISKSEQYNVVINKPVYWFNNILLAIF